MAAATVIASGMTAVIATTIVAASAAPVVPPGAVAGVTVSVARAMDTSSLPANVSRIAAAAISKALSFRRIGAS